MRSREICAAFAALVRAADGHPTVDVVVGPTTGGVILAFETARQLGLRGLFAEEVKDADGTARREFRRGFHLEPGARVLLVDDILTTGGSLLAMLPPIEASGAELVRTAVIVDRSGGTRTVTSPTSGREYPSTRSGRSTSRPTSRAPHLPGVRRGATHRSAWLERHQRVRRNAARMRRLSERRLRPTTSMAVCSSSAPIAPSNLAATLPSAPTTKT